MASRLRLPRRVQLPSRLSCPHSSPSSRSFTPSTTLAAKPAARRPRQTITLRTQHVPKLPPSPSSSDQPQSLAVLINQRKWPLFGAGFMALAVGLYISLVVTSTLKNKPTTPSPTSTPSPSPSPSPIPTTTPPSPCCQPAPTGLPATLDPSNPLSATNFDKSLDLPERLMGLTSLRKTLASRARGHVLEVAVGTGRNLAYYDWSEVVSLSQDEEEKRAERERERVVRLLDERRLGGPVLAAAAAAAKGKGEDVEEIGTLEGEVLSFTGVDVSGEMIGVARDRIREAVPGLRRIMRRRRLEEMPRLKVDQVGAEGVPVVDALDGRVRLVMGDAVRGLPSPPAALKSPGAWKEEAVKPAPTKYDTIIQTFGLCSVADPGSLLANMAAKVQPDTGRIILLEHGRGTYDWMNNRLDKSAPDHFHKYGCWWNRDIEQLVREAAQKVPGLEVVKLERPLWFQWGTTLLIELKVNGHPSGKGVSQKA